MCRTYCIMAVQVESDVTHPLFMLFFSFLFTGQPAVHFMFICANLFFLPPLRNVGLPPLLAVCK